MKVKADKELVEHVAKLARIKILEEEKAEFASQFNSILQFFSKIDEVNTENVEPAFQPINLKNVLREDEVKKFDWDPLANTKHKENKHFKGPKIV
jgi:aspartyl-tRNA(Asn)/glutamyl-tRNA(Gln) amidotransferase subunit C